MAGLRDSITRLEGAMCRPSSAKSQTALSLAVASQLWPTLAMTEIPPIQQELASFDLLATMVVVVDAEGACLFANMAFRERDPGLAGRLSWARAAGHVLRAATPHRNAGRRLGQGATPATALMASCVGAWAQDGSAWSISCPQMDGPGRKRFVVELIAAGASSAAGPRRAPSTRSRPPRS